MSNKTSSTNFEPTAGFPPLVRADDTAVPEGTLESRGFSTNIVNISNIIESKKKENLFLAFGSEDEDGIDYYMNNFVEQTPHKYSEFDYKNLLSERKSK